MEAWANLKTLAQRSYTVGLCFKEPNRQQQNRKRKNTQVQWPTVRERRGPNQIASNNTGSAKNHKCNGQLSEREEP
jgi:hypothetical protein